MEKTSGQPASFDGLTIKFALEKPIEMDVFRADATNYAPRLRAREDIPGGLKLLISKLFEEGAITNCCISYGRRVDMRLAELDRRGRTLLEGRRLEYFRLAFAKITGEELTATRQNVGSTAGGRASGGRDYSPLLEALVNVTSAVADGLQLAAAIEILTGDR